MENLEMTQGSLVWQDGKAFTSFGVKFMYFGAETIVT